jgi:hypothetical protein
MNRSVQQTKAFRGKATAQWSPRGRRTSAWVKASMRLSRYFISRCGQSLRCFRFRDRQIRKVTGREYRKSNIFDGARALFGWLRSPKLLERAEIAAKQMRYFRVFSQRGSFEGLGASAKRAGFEMIYEDVLGKVAGFRWAADGDPDFTFLVSFADPEAVLVTADSYGDIFGLVMTSISNVPKIIVEAKPWLAKDEFGRHARVFRKILLTFPDFDAERLPIRFQI